LVGRGKERKTKKKEKKLNILLGRRGKTLLVQESRTMLGRGREKVDGRGKRWMTE